VLVDKGIVGKEAEAVGLTCKGPVHGFVLESARYWRWWWGQTRCWNIVVWWVCGEVG
jgi:hypothetical protein